MLFPIYCFYCFIVCIFPNAKKKIKPTWSWCYILAISYPWYWPLKNPYRSTAAEIFFGAFSPKIIDFPLLGLECSCNSILGIDCRWRKQACAAAANSGKQQACCCWWWCWCFFSVCKCEQAEWAWGKCATSSHLGARRSFQFETVY